MPSPAEYEPIEDDEILYRRVPVSMKWVTPDGVKPEAFQATHRDTTGISVSRARFRTVEETAKGSSKGGYYVLALRAGALRDAGIVVVPRPIDESPGHSEVTSLAYQEPEPNVAMAQRKLLADELVLNIYGPFPSQR